jgi:cell division protein FtsB
LAVGLGPFAVGVGAGPMACPRFRWLPGDSALEGGFQERREARVSVKGAIVALITGLAMVGLLVVSIFGEKGLTDLNQLKGELHQIKEHITRLEQENLALYRYIDRLRNDPDFIENVARQELGMIGKDELIINFRNPEGPEGGK